MTNLNSRASFGCAPATGTTTIAPWGGSEAKLGNNPFGFGLPNPGGDPLMLDMAMSVVARAKIRSAAKAGERIPDSWATDRDGNPTTDPAAALGGFLQPVGGHKGYGLALVVDLIAGLLSGAAYLSHVKSWVDTPEEPQNLGHYFLLIDVGQLGSSAWLTERISDFTSILHDTPPRSEDSPLLMVKLFGLRHVSRILPTGSLNFAISFIECLIPSILFLFKISLSTKCFLLTFFTSFKFSLINLFEFFSRD